MINKKRTIKTFFSPEECNYFMSPPPTSAKLSSIIWLWKKGDGSKNILILENVPLYLSVSLILTLVIDDRNLIHLLNGLPNLQFLNLQHCYNITRKGMKHIKEPLLKMEFVDLFASEIKDAG